MKIGDRIIFTRDAPGSTIASFGEYLYRTHARRGERGAVVDIDLLESKGVVTVEVCDDDGRTLALVDCSVDDVELDPS